MCVVFAIAVGFFSEILTFVPTGSAQNQKDLETFIDKAVRTDQNLFSENGPTILRVGSCNL